MTDFRQLCCGSHYLEVRTDGHGNRSAVASQQIKAGIIITQNAPFAYSLRHYERDERCARCFAKHRKVCDGEESVCGVTPPLARCSRCKIAKYCSRDCQRTDYPLHKTECKNPVFPPAVADEASLLVRTYLRLSKSCDPSQINCSISLNGCDAVVVCGSSHFHAMAMSSHALDPLDEITITVANEFCPKWNKSPRLDNAEKALRIFRVNNFGVTDSMLNVIGGGVYPHGALLNHSCNPNCVLRYHFHPQLGPVMQVVALRAIKEGEELTHSYVDLANVTKIRRDRLQAIHGFRCECARCNGDFCLTLPRDFMGGNGTVTGWVLERMLNETETIDCEDAKSMTSLDQGMVVAHVEIDHSMASFGISITETTRQQAIILTSKRMQDDARGHMAQGHLDLELKSLHEAVSIFSSDPSVRFSPFSVDLYSARCALLSTLLVAGRTADALEQCRHIVAFLYVAFTHIPHHPLLGLQLYTLGDLYHAT